MTAHDLYPLPSTATGNWSTRGLRAWDDYPVHQVAEVLSVAGERDKGFTDRWYFNVQEDDGRLIAIVGAGFYPNTGICEGYFCVVENGRQINLRTVVDAGMTSPSIEVGPLRFEIDEPMHSWRVALRHPSLTADLSFDGGDTIYHYEPLWAGRDAAGGGQDFYQHVVQAGRIAGTIAADGRELWQGTAQSTRDRTWGVRSRRPKLHNWYVMYFDDLMFGMIHDERRDGSVLFSEAAVVGPDGGFHRLVAERHDLKFDPITREVLEGVWRLHDGSGQDVRLQFTRVGESVRGLGAGYDEKQGTGDVGSSGAQTTEWPLANREVALRVGRGTIDTPVRASLEFAGSAPLQGFGVAETAIGRSHVRYGADLRTEA